uniref:Uncharacterized protein n=1 Tax=Oryza meridionalis TaxID=40149 RepID=A0A0E0C2Z1_9ORYZ
IVSIAPNPSRHPSPSLQPSPLNAHPSPSLTAPASISVAARVGSGGSAADGAPVERGDGGEWRQWCGDDSVSCSVHLCIGTCSGH